MEVVQVEVTYGENYSVSELSGANFRGVSCKGQSCRVGVVRMGQL